MKLTSTRENLLYSLDIASTFAGKHANLPILQNILIRAHESGVEISATNLEVSIKTHIRAKVEEPGSFTVPARTVTEYIRLLTNDQVELTLEGNELVIRSSGSETKIKGFPAEEYPVIPGIEEGHTYLINANILKETIAKVSISCAKNEIRPEFSGVFCRFKSERYDGLLMAATDSYRLSEARVPIAQGEDGEVTCIIPGRVAHEIARLIQFGRQHEGEENVRVTVSDNQIAIRYDMFEMVSRLIEGRYPDYTQIIPTAFKTQTTFPVSELMNKIKAASLFSTVGVNAISFELDPTKKHLGVSSISAQTGAHTSYIDTDVQGEQMTVLLNHRYVLDGLQQIAEDEAQMQINSPDAPCLIKVPGNETFQYIVMPIRQ
ncbi:MAG TPA: DNA polymerase III subunit beta [Candidatus Magasanikbacteria bacterium]|nr:DNA polymerase III subunit beta [Candidatus Magasanikbacteria bacterium]